MSSGLFVLFGLYLLLGLFIAGVLLIPVVILIYNRFVALKESIDAAWSDIDVLLRKRIDLLGNLAEAVKGYTDHEETLFRETTALRADVLQGGELTPARATEGPMRGLFHNLLAVAENYPELKADRSFAELQAAIGETEDRIEEARRVYNQCVKFYNIRRQAFPSNLVARLFGFTSADFFEIEESEARQGYSFELNAD